MIKKVKNSQGSTKDCRAIDGIIDHFGLCLFDAFCRFGFTFAELQGQLNMETLIRNVKFYLYYFFVYVPYNKNTNFSCFKRSKCHNKIWGFYLCFAEALRDGPPWSLPLKSVPEYLTKSMEETSLHFHRIALIVSSIVISVSKASMTEKSELQYRRR
jgi:hypothetical protein